MESKTTEKFRKCFESLPDIVQEEARKVYAKWRTNPYNEKLKFKKIHNKGDIYSVRIGLNWRAIGLKNEDKVIWFWIGSHSDYDKLIKKLK